MTPFLAKWTPGDRTTVEVTVIAFTQGDAVVVVKDGTLDRARLRDLQVDWLERPEDWPTLVPA